MRQLKLLLFSFFFFSVSMRVLGQIRPDSSKASIVIKFSFIPFVNETVVFGKIVTTTDSLFFNTTPCREQQKKISSVFPCNAHLIKPIGISFNEIKKMKRRAFLFLIPNRLFIQTKSNDTYLFITYKRRLIKRKYQSYLDSL